MSWSEFSAWIVIQVVLLYSEDDMVVSTKRIQPTRGWCATVKRDCANCIHLILPLRRPGPPVFWGSQSYDPRGALADMILNTGSICSCGKTNTKTLLHSLTKYTNSQVQSSSLSPAHSPPTSPTSVQSPLQNTPTYHRASIQLHTLIYLKQHTGPVDVSQEGVPLLARWKGRLAGLP